MYTHNEIKQMLKDYSWMINGVEAELKDIDSNSISMYGVEATMPKKKGGHSDKVWEIVLKNEMGNPYIKKLAKKIELMDSFDNYIIDDREQCILRLTKRGYTQYEIGKVVNLHQSQVNKRLDKIIEKIVKSLN